MRIGRRTRRGLYTVALGFAIVAAGRLTASVTAVISL